MKVPLLNFEGGPGISLTNFEGGPGVPLLNFERGPGCPGSRGPGSRGPGPIFTPCLYGYLHVKYVMKSSGVFVFQSPIFEILIYILTYSFNGCF